MIYKRKTLSNDSPPEEGEPRELKMKSTNDLELHSLPFQLNGAYLEVDSNSANIALRIGVVREPQKQARLETEGLWFERQHIHRVLTRHFIHLADTRVANEEEFKKIVVLACMHAGQSGQYTENEECL